jgi:hypothetical protein
VAETAEVDALDAVAQKAGGIDVSFNLISHGAVQGTPMVEASLDDYERPVVTAVRTTFLTTRAAACWGDKARWLFWRPITAIHQADRDGNPATEADPAWLPLINTPPYPDHPSGLTCIGSAMARSLRDFFGTDQLEFSSTNTSLNLTRSYTSFSQAIDEIVDARVWSGVHFRIADVHGARIGGQIARYRKQHYFHRTKPRACEEDHVGVFEYDDPGER